MKTYIEKPLPDFTAHPDAPPVPLREDGTPLVVRGEDKSKVLQGYLYTDLTWKHHSTTSFKDFLEGWWFSSGDLFIPDVTSDYVRDNLPEWHLKPETWKRLSKFVGWEIISTPASQLFLVSSKLVAGHYITYQAAAEAVIEAHKKHEIKVGKPAQHLTEREYANKYIETVVTCAGMNAENHTRATQGQPLTYSEADFQKLLDWMRPQPNDGRRKKERGGED